MRNKTKMVAVLTGSALLAMASAMSSMAAPAKGWQEQNGQWVYLDSYGDRVTDTWKKSGDHWFYLDSDGYMARNALIDNDGDNYSYVNEAGAMVTNEWHYIDEDGELNWYYFGSNGKTEDNGWESIKAADGKTYRYHFSDNKMDYGWFTDDNDRQYYLGDENSGYARTGWQYLYEDDDESKEEGWYYFDTNGKMVRDQEKKINGQYYTFDENGLMMDNWVNYPGPTASSSNSYKFYEESVGNRADGWQYLEEMDADEYGMDAEEGWYYFKSGRAYGLDGYKTHDIGNGYGLVKIGGKTYCFDENGRMQAGTIEDGKGRVFYFGEEDDGAMKTGRVKIKYSDDYEDEYMCFADKGTLGDKGAAVTGVDGGYLYDNGLMVKAESDKYEIVEVDGLDYLVKENGKVVTKGTVKDNDAGVSYTVTKAEDGGYNIETKLLD